MIKTLKKADVMLIAAITLFALAFNVFFSLRESGRPQGAFVAVSVAGKAIVSFPLNEDGSHEIGQGGRGNVFAIESGSVRMTGADCPDGLCLRQKSISRSGETIVCLPNKLILTVEGAPESGVDAIAYSCFALIPRVQHAKQYDREARQWQKK